MGWRGKLISLLIVYFAGFVTAIYYLAPDRNQCQAADYYGTDNGSQHIDSAAVKDFCNKAYTKASESFSQIDWQDLKERFTNCVRKLTEKAKNSQNKPPEGAEDN